MDIHNASDLMAVISQEIPIDVTAALMESTRVKNKVIASMTDVENLSGIAFLLGSGQKAKNLDSWNLKHRIADLSYVKVVCCLDGQVKDMRIKQLAINVQFCTKLPQAIYDSETGVVEPVFNPTKTKPDTANSVSRKSNLFAEVDEEQDSANESDDNKQSGSTFTSPPRSGTTTPSTISMSMIVGL